MRKIIKLALALTLLSWASTTLAADLRVGVEGAYPPFSTTSQDGELSGFDIDIARALCENLDRKCRFVNQDWNALIPGLLSRKYDAVIASLPISDEYGRRVDFTNKYYQMPVRFVAAKETNLRVSENGLKDKRIGVKLGSVFDKYVTDIYGSVAEIVRYRSQEELYLDLQTGELDATLAERAVVEDTFFRSPTAAKFELVRPDIYGQRWFGKGRGIAVRNSDVSLRRELNRAIRTIRLNGTYKKINAKYFDYDIYGE